MVARRTHPTTASLQGRLQGRQVVGQEGAHVQEQGVLLDAGDDGGLGLAQAGLQLLGVRGGCVKGQGPAGQAHLGQRPAAHPGDALHYLEPHLRPQERA